MQNLSIAVIESLDHEARGVAHVDGKAVFIDGALPGETVTYKTLKRKPSYDFGEVVAVLKLLAPDRKLELSGLTPTVQKVFRLTRMDSIFVIHDGVPDGFRHAG